MLGMCVSQTARYIREKSQRLDWVNGLCHEFKLNEIWMAQWLMIIIMYIYFIIYEFSSMKFHSPTQHTHMCDQVTCIYKNNTFEFQWKPRNVSQIDVEICHST